MGMLGERGQKVEYRDFESNKELHDCAFGRLEPAGTLKQHCPQMTCRRCILSHLAMMDKDKTFFWA